MNSKDEKFTPKIPSSPELFWIGNLEFQVKNDFVLAVSAMPELEDDEGIILPEKELPTLWRAWVMSIGPGIYLPKASFLYNPGIQRQDFIYFLPKDGRFFDFDNISFVFVRMTDICLVARR